MRLILDTEALEQLFDPSKRDPEEEAARLALLQEARELGKRLIIRPAPTSPTSENAAPVKGASV